MSAQDFQKFAQADIDVLLNKLSLDEKISLLAGPDWWTTAPIPRLGIPPVKCSDGPNGVRGKSHFRPTPAACIPCATALGATFDTALITEVGGLLARESAAKSASLLLAPTVNIQRNPLNGRAFESFSEDPFLSGMTAAGYVNGLQENGVGACIKHFVGNDMEHERFSVDVVIPERPLREIYLMPFMIAQKLAKPWSVMTSYSRLNGPHASENYRLLQSILRDEWKFDGFVMSDWTGTYSTVEAILAGLDLEMPGPTRWRGDLVKVAIGSKKLKVTDIDARARKVLEYVQRSVKTSPSIVAGVSGAETTHDTPEDRALNRKVAANAIVLLKNSENVLPIKPEVKTLAVIGPNAKTRTVSGGGSAYLTSSYVVTPYEGLTAAAKTRGIDVQYAPGCYGHRYLPMLDGWMKTAGGSYGWTARFYNEDPKAGGALVAEVDLYGSRLRINDEKPAGIAQHFYIEIETFVTAPSTGVYEFGLSLAGGRANVMINGHEILDNGLRNKQTPGASFYGLGTIEEIGEIEFVEGETYKVEILYTSVPLPKSEDDEEGGRSQPALMMAALRLGAAPKIDTEQAMVDAIELAKTTDAVVAIIGTNMDIEAEADDRPSLALPGKTDEFIKRLLAVRPDAVIVNQSGSAVAMPWVKDASTLLQSWFGGNETGNAIADVVFGEHNPTARMPITFPWKIQDCTAHLNWGAENGRVLYGEGLFVGYRGYEETDRDVMFAFGEGLSYTTFEWSPVTVSINTPETADDLVATVSLTVTNTGAQTGADVVQIYVSDPVSSLRRPGKELKAFAKVELAPGQSKVVTLPLDKQSFAFYDDASSCWTAEKGAFIIRAARSSRAADEQSTAETKLVKTFTWTGI